MGESNKASFSLESVVTTALKIPGVKVSRNQFLASQFADPTFRLYDILESGPVEAGISREKLNAKAKNLILLRTSESSLVSFAAGIPGGLAMAATIPADLLQFFGMTLRLAQELSYLYGARDLWSGGELDNEQVRNQLILYCGVMFGVTGASAGVRVLTAQIAKTTLKKLPQKALTKTFWYPLVKQIGKAIGLHVTKKTVASGIAKAIPVIGGVISGSINFASMMPMANRLHSTLDKACFDYTQDELNADVIEIDTLPPDSNEAEQPSNVISAKKKGVSQFLSSTIEKAKDTATKPFTKDKDSGSSQQDDVFSKIEKLNELKNKGIITEEEFTAKKSELLERL